MSDCPSVIHHLEKDKAELEFAIKACSYRLEIVIKDLSTATGKSHEALTIWKAFLERDKELLSLLHDNIMDVTAKFVALHNENKE